MIALVLTSGIVLLRSLREPVVAALQAMLLGKQAAMFSLAGAAVTAPLAILVLLMATGEPTWSLLGALAGETLFFSCSTLLLLSAQKQSIAP